MTFSCQCAASKRTPPRRCPGGLRPSATIPAWWSMRSTARPASIRRAGPGRRRISPRAMTRDRTAAAGARRHDAGAAQGAFRLRAVRRLARRSSSKRSRRASTARWSGRRAAAHGFGYDPVFLPDGHARTFGEMTSIEKHGLPPLGLGLSHRARAFVKLAEICLERATRLSATRQSAFGIYVHWPFCPSKCPYCDFNSHVRGRGSTRGAWPRVRSRARHRGPHGGPGGVVVFFGGGTPSLMEAGTAAPMLEAIGRAPALATEVEIALEANPTTVEAARSWQPRGRRQPGVARHAGVRRCGTQVARPAARRPKRRRGRGGTKRAFRGDAASI